VRDSEYKFESPFSIFVSTEHGWDRDGDGDYDDLLAYIVDGNRERIASFAIIDDNLDGKYESVSVTLGPINEFGERNETTRFDITLRLQEKTGVRPQHPLSIHLGGGIHGSKNWSVYVELDLDGVFDKRGETFGQHVGRTNILYQHRWLTTSETISHHEYIVTTASGREDRYVFEDGEWRQR
jgi:hypothetical protein